ncbi:hypothetical protein FLAG1_03397 [Fusarium langsethiae]|uniref:Uncharacterized protein n=1 Tax=Fusarium langsethiae TaxID=179993 RepID=A0A0M9F0Q3_FUSLA|nr:hypothetical protein FLAG1_03397 [Fusarium langsethiae]GKU01253.1 unnamed protein product [Fusarium langsethiae]GKU10972.1 unnamed protein product [Fusarium langsethiae]
MPLALRNLEVVITQEEKNPVLMRTAVKNNNDHPVTILSYGSPLDALAIQLGTLYITPKGGSEALEILQIEASRLWPPMEDALIELGAGQTAIWESTLQEPVVPMDSVFEGATVQLKGTWTAVWPREKEGIDFSELEEGTPINGTLTGSYKSNVLDIQVA